MVGVDVLKSRSIMNNELVMDHNFVLSLEGLIIEMRDKINDLPDKTIKGYRFKNDEFVRRLIIKYLKYSRNPDPDDYITSQQIRGIGIHTLKGTMNEVITGKFDVLVQRALIQAAEYDYSASQNPKLH